MNNQSTPKPRRILNIGLAAHVDAGKTTLTEQLLLASGALRHMGSVDTGTTQTDFLEIERSRGISVRSSSVSFDWKDVRINLIDTPGHADFAGEVERALATLDVCVLLVSAVEGIQAQTEAIMDALEKLELPCLIFINKLDRAGADYNSTLDELRRRLSMELYPLTVPAGEGENVKAVSVSGEELTETLITSGGDDGLLERFLDGDTISEKEITDAVCKAVQELKCAFVLCGSSKLGIGVNALLDTLTAYYVPEPPNNQELAGVVYKVEHDKTLGKLAHIRLFSGSLSSRDAVYLPRTDAEEKITQAFSVSGQKTVNSGHISAGELAAVTGLSSVRAGDIVGRGKIPRIPCSMAVPLLTVRAEAVDGTDIMKLLSAFRELADEDPLLEVTWVASKQEIHIRTTGTIQLDVLTAFLKERYNIAVKFSEPSIIYKETPIRAARGWESYTMPKPCWAEVEFWIEPGPRGSGLVYKTDLDPRLIEYRYQAHIETSVPKALQQGRLGWEVTDLSVTLTGGSWHHVHTHPLDFFVATPMAIQDGLVNTGTKLLEPILEVRMRAPEECMGRAVGMLVNNRGEFDSPVTKNGLFELSARVPAEEAMQFPVTFAAMTGGHGQLGMRFLEYAPCPEGHGQARERFGIDPLDRSKWILHARGAYAGNIE